MHLSTEKSPRKTRTQDKCLCFPFPNIITQTTLAQNNYEEQKSKKVLKGSILAVWKLGSWPWLGNDDKKWPRRAVTWLKSFLLSPKINTKGRHSVLPHPNTGLGEKKGNSQIFMIQNG